MNITNLRRRFTAGALAICTAGALAGPASATNGYFANGYGGGSKGMAGAGVAVQTGVLGLAQNPAMGTKVGNKAGFCLTTFMPDRGFTMAGQKFDSVNDVFLIPCGGVNFELNERSALGFYMFGNGGMNTEYRTNPFQGFMPPGAPPLPEYGVNLEQLFISANYSYQVNDQLTLGFAPVLAVQRFRASGLEPFAAMSADPTKVTGNGDNWSSGLGVNLGMTFEPTDNLTFGLAYRSKIDMEKFSKYAGLFAQQGDFDIPAMATVGLAYRLPNNPRLTLTGEYQRIFYGDIPSLSRSGAVLNPAVAPLGAANGPGFGWKDMDVFRIGAVFKANDRLTLRGGVSHASSFSKSNEVLFNTLAPATTQWHASVGASYKLNDNWGITGSYTRVFNSTKSGANQTPGFGAPVKLRMDQHEMAIGMTYTW